MPSNTGNATITSLLLRLGSLRRTLTHTHSVIARIYTIVGIVNGQGIILLLRSTGMLRTAETREKPTSHQICFR